MIMLPIFPTIIHGMEVENFKKVQKELVKFAYTEEKKHTDDQQASNEGGWHSTRELHFENSILTKVVTTTIGKYFEEVGCFRENVEAELNSLWLMINREGHWNQLHCHPGSILSGVFWIKSPPGSGKIEFNSPHYYDRNQEVESYTEDLKKSFNNYNTFSFVPVEGSMMLFPSSLYHMVEPNTTGKDRIAASFNINLRYKQAK